MPTVSASTPGAGCDRDETRRESLLKSTSYNLVEIVTQPAVEQFVSSRAAEPTDLPPRRIRNKGLASRFLPDTPQVPRIVQRIDESLLGDRFHTPAQSLRR